MDILATDAVRLVSTVGFLWAGWRDARDRRVPPWVWRPLLLVGVGVLAVDAVAGRWSAVTTAALSFLFAIGVSNLAGQLGLWGGADSNALAALAVMFPVAPTGAPTLAPFPVAVFAAAVGLTAGWMVAAWAVGDGDDLEAPFVTMLAVALVLTMAVGGPYWMVRFY